MGYGSTTRSRKVYEMYLNKEGLQPLDSLLIKFVDTKATKINPSKYGTMLRKHFKEEFEEKYQTWFKAGINK